MVGWTLALAAIGTAAIFKYFGILGRARVILAFAGGTALVGTSIAGTISGALSSLGGAVGTAVGLLAFLFAAVWAFVDVKKDGKCDWGAITAAALTPVLAVGIGGVVGQLFTAVSTRVSDGAASVFTQLFG